MSPLVVMERFYHKLYDDNDGKRMNKAEALREAMLEIRDFRDESDNQPFTESYSWAQCHH